MPNTIITDNQYGELGQEIIGGLENIQNSIEIPRFHFGFWPRFSGNEIIIR